MEFAFSSARKMEEGCSWCYAAGVTGVLVAEASLDKVEGLGCFCFLVFFFFVGTTAGRPPKLPRAEMSSLVLHVVHTAPSGGEQNTTEEETEAKEAMTEF